MRALCHPNSKSVKARECNTYLKATSIPLRHACVAMRLTFAQIDVLRWTYGRILPSISHHEPNARAADRKFRPRNSKVVSGFTLVSGYSMQIPDSILVGCMICKRRRRIVLSQLEDGQLLCQKCSRLISIVDTSPMSAWIDQEVERKRKQPGLSVDSTSFWQRERHEAGIRGRCDLLFADK